MDPHFSDATTASSIRIAGAAALRLELLQEAEEDRLAIKGKTRLWPMIVGILMLVVLLLAFCYVVNGSMLQSGLRQKAEARRAEALWRCNSLQGREVSGGCQLRVNAEARRVALLRFPDTP